MSENKFGEPHDNPHQAEPPRKSSNGCLWGCLVMFLLFSLAIVGVTLGSYWWFKNQVHRYTADAPADLPTVEMTDAERVAVRGRVDDFKETIEAGETPEDLVLTADEINALITSDKELRGKIYVTIEDGKVAGDLSVPADFIPGGKGRFINASATFDVSLENGVLIVTLAEAKVKGEKVPEQFIEGLRQENLAKDMYKDPEVAKTLRRIESISIEHDKIVLKPRAATAQAEMEGAESEESPDTGEPRGTE